MKGPGQRPRTILLREDLVEAVRDQRGDALEHGLAQRVQVAGAVAVEVLAAPDAGMGGGAGLAQAGDVDEQAVAHVDPASVDDVLPVAAHALHAVRVHVEEVRALHVRAVRVVVHRHVEVRAEPGQRRGRDLHVQVPVPGHDAAVPPPAQQRAVGDPRLDVALAEGGEVGADQVVEGVGSLVVGHRLPLVVADIVVAEVVGAAGFVEVLGVGLFADCRGEGGEEEGSCGEDVAELHVEGEGRREVVEVLHFSAIHEVVKVVKLWSGGIGVPMKRRTS